MPKLVLIVTVPQSLVFFEEQIPYFKSEGIETEVITSGGPALGDFCKKYSVKGHDVNMERSIAPIKDLFSLIKLILLLKKINPDIVHSGTPKGGLLGMIASFFLNIPIRIYTIHGLRFETLTGIKATIVRLMEKISVFFSTQVIAVSPSLLNVAVMNNICPERKIKVILNGSCNGVDALNRFNPDHILIEEKIQLRKELKIQNGNFVIGFVGRLVNDKGVKELISAWNVVRQEYANISLLIIGDFEHEDILPKYIINTITTSSDIVHVKKTNYIEKYYSIIDIFVLPTYREGFGNVLIEAGAMRLPVITTNITGAKDAILDQVTGFLVPVKNHEIIADKILKYIKCCDLRNKHGNAGREWVLKSFVNSLIHKELTKQYLSNFHSIRNNAN